MEYQTTLHLSEVIRYGWPLVAVALLLVTGFYKTMKCHYSAGDGFILAGIIVFLFTLVYWVVLSTVGTWWPVRIVW